MPPPSDPIFTASLSLCSGLDMEERTRQMKLKMNKYKQGAGSDSRLEQDYHKVRRGWGGNHSVTCASHASVPGKCALTVNRRHAIWRRLSSQRSVHACTYPQRVRWRVRSVHSGSPDTCENRLVGDQRSEGVRRDSGCYCKVAEGER